MLSSRATAVKVPVRPRGFQVSSYVTVSLAPRSVLRTACVNMRPSLQRQTSCPVESRMTTSWVLPEGKSISTAWSPTLVTRRLTLTLWLTVTREAAVRAAVVVTFLGSVSDREGSFVVLATDSLCLAWGLQATNTAPTQSNQMTKRELMGSKTGLVPGRSHGRKGTRRLRAKLSTAGRVVKGVVTRKLC